MGLFACAGYICRTFLMNQPTRRIIWKLYLCGTGSSSNLVYLVYGNNLNDGFKLYMCETLNDSFMPMDSTFKYLLYLLFTVMDISLKFIWVFRNFIHFNVLLWYLKLLLKELGLLFCCLLVHIGLIYFIFILFWSAVFILVSFVFFGFRKFSRIFGAALSDWNKIPHCGFVMVRSLLCIYHRSDNKKIKIRQACITRKVIA
jgi:hypothetical protein